MRLWELGRICGESDFFTIFKILWLVLFRWMWGEGKNSDSVGIDKREDGMEREEGGWRDFSRRWYSLKV